MASPGAPGTTGTAERPNSIQVILTEEMEFEAARMQVWGQFPMVPADGVITGGNAGQTVQLRFQQLLRPKTDIINEKADITPVQVTDNVVDVTINEYGNAVQLTKFVQIVQKGDVASEIGHVIAENLVASLDRLAGRQYYEGNDIVFRANGVATRASLDSTNDTMSASAVGLPFLGRAIGTLRASKVPGFSTGKDGMPNYATVIHTALAQDLPFTSGFTPALQYKDGVDTLFNGEIGDMLGLRFTESNQGKVYPGAGTTAQAATQLNGAVTSQATTIVVDSASGIAVGDIITIGTLEDGATITTEASAGDMLNGNVESVLVTAVDSTTLTITGLGYSDGDTSVGGLRYDHANDAAVTDADLVAAIPIFGPQSVMKAYAAEAGPFGKSVVSGPFDVLQRFKNVGWWAVCGWARTRRHYSVRLEVATRFPHMVINE